MVEEGKSGETEYYFIYVIQYSPLFIILIIVAFFVSVRY